MKKKSFRSLMFVMAFALCLAAGLMINPVKVNAATKAKVVFGLHDGSTLTWKTGKNKVNLQQKNITYVYFGNYPQSEVKGKKLTASIRFASYNKNGVATVQGQKYKKAAYIDEDGIKVYAYFKFEPIKWRVLSNKDGKLLLLSDVTLDCQNYSKDHSETVWKDCSLRKWLNNSFLKTAFNKNERNLIKKTELTNSADRSGALARGGGKTKDQIFLLSLDDIFDGLYGLEKNKEARECAASDMAYKLGYSEMKTQYTWWLRSPGSDNNHAAVVGLDGVVSEVGNGFYVNCGVRPVLTIDISDMVKNQKEK